MHPESPAWLMQLASAMISLAILFPVMLALLFAFAIGWKKPNEEWESPVGWMAMGAMGISLVFVLILSAFWLANGRPLMEIPLPWGIFGTEPVFLWDEATALWGTVTALMGLATIRFSVTYLHREPGYVRFMAVALAFLGSMLGAIAADNPVQMAAWWEIIGASSLLLIGFYHERQGPCTGAVAVLRQYRIADAGMLLGCGLMLAYEVHGSFSSITTLPAPVTLVCSMGFLVAVLVKSAQLPFSGWLPRAMEGPTPSSALFYGGLSLHLGILLALRLHGLWEHSIFARGILIVCGIATALDAGIRSRVTPDAKTALAWSAMSTIGVLFVILGLGYWQLVVPLVAGHAIIRWYQLLRAPSTPVDLAWYRRAMGQPLAQRSPEMPRLRTWLAIRSLFKRPVFSLGLAISSLRSACTVFGKVAGNWWGSMIPLLVASVQAWIVFEHVEGGRVILAVLACAIFMFIATAPFLKGAFWILQTGFTGALAVILTAFLHEATHGEIQPVLIWGGTIAVGVGVITVVGARSVTFAVSGAIQALGGMSVLSIAGGHGQAWAAAILLLGAGTIGSHLVWRVAERIGDDGWTNLGGVGRGAPRFHATILLLLGLLIGMPPWPSFHVIDGAVETAALVSPWLSTTISLFWAIVAFHVGRALIEACWGPARGAVLEGPIPDLINREWFPTLAALAALGVAGFISGVMPHHPDLPEGVIPKSHEGLHGAHIHDHHNKIPTTEFATRKIQEEPISLTEGKPRS
jgi:NADH:ubiquinone oxidoreductase subunit 5 (subunit L)/multisubunit Na+/H+ antiporter MnhA subunit